mmetsp:Transcript_8831/g.33345  ORF Transcript_8831/g.33345 Transcript_8831/m.33345 type:complete len:359 (-) Transcript_8831:83-1159(-)
MGTHTPPNEAEVQPGRPSEQAPPPAEGWQGKIVMVNLIDHKGVQQRLGEAFSDLVDAAVHSLAGRAVLPPLRYIWFDFHKECSHMQWSRLSNLLEKLVEDVAGGGWFHQGGEACKFSILRVQKGIVRTNCMDNLDRTNVVQSLIARHVLLQCLEERDSIGRQPSGGNGHTADHRHAAPYTTKAGVGGKNVLDSGIPVLEKAFKAIWGNNADAMSLLYAGSEALKTDFTRTGKRTMAGRCKDLRNSIWRYYVNNFGDGLRQDAIDLMLLNFSPRADRASPFMPKPKQETMSTVLTKIYVLFVVVFALCLVAMDEKLDDVLCLSLQAVMVLVVSTAVHLFRNGSRLGKRMVCHPCLLQET